MASKSSEQQLNRKNAKIATEQSVKLRSNLFSMLISHDVIKNIQL